jgi:hypothetical protein
LSEARHRDRGGRCATVPAHPLTSHAEARYPGWLRCIGGSGVGRHGATKPAGRTPLYTAGLVKTAGATRTRGPDSLGLATVAERATRASVGIRGTGAVLVRCHAPVGPRVAPLQPAGALPKALASARCREELGFQAGKSSRRFGGPNPQSTSHVWGLKSSFADGFSP